jgi:hypothetical protein
MLVPAARGMKPPTGEEKNATRRDRYFELLLILLPLAHGKLDSRAASIGRGRVAVSGG